MTDSQRLFLVQGRTDFLVFELLRGRSGLPACHALHYLQMATEMLGKASAWRYGRPQATHRAFVTFLRGISTNRQAQRLLGYEGQNENWHHVIRKSVPLARRVEDLAPALAQDAPNPEYPWPRASPVAAPAEYDFDIWREITSTAAGRQFISLARSLFAVADSFL